MVLEYDRGNVIQETAAKTGAIAFSTVHAPALDAPVVSWFGQLQPSTTVYDLGTDVRGDVTIAFKNGAAHEEQLLSAYGEREAFDAGGNGCVEGLDAGSRSLPVAGCTTLTTDLVDCHMYVLSRPALKLLAAKPNLSSLKLDFIPWLTRHALKGSRGGSGSSADLYGSSGNVSAAEAALARHGSGFLLGGARLALGLARLPSGFLAGLLLGCLGLQSF